MKPNRLWVLFLIDTFSFTLVLLSWYHTQKKKKNEIREQSVEQVYCVGVHGNVLLAGEDGW